jgi:hypothetical protein
VQPPTPAKLIKADGRRQPASPRWRRATTTSAPAEDLQAGKLTAGEVKTRDRGGSAWLV